MMMILIVITLFITVIIPMLLDKFEIKTLGNAISSILGINKSVVRDNFY